MQATVSTNNLSAEEQRQLKQAQLERLAFHPMHGLDEREEVQKNTRVFVGDGTPYLKVPGLLKLEQVRLSSLVLPKTIAREFPTDATLTRMETIEMPMVLVQQAQDGTPILRRNRVSNDGVWQLDEAIYVTGEWDENVVEEIPVIPAKKGRK